MAFTIVNLENHSGSGAGVKLWSYKSGDAIAAVEGAGYFNDAAGLLSIGMHAWIPAGRAQELAALEGIPDA